MNHSSLVIYITSKLFYWYHTDVKTDSQSIKTNKLTWRNMSLKNHEEYLGQMKEGDAFPICIYVYFKGCKRIALENINLWSKFSKLYF